MSFEQFVDWAYLGTFAGVVTVVSIIVQFTKEYLPIPTQLYSYIVSIIVIFLAEIFEAGGDGLTLSEAVLALFNGLIVSVAANGSYDVLNKFMGGNKNAK